MNLIFDKLPQCYHRADQRLIANALTIGVAIAYSDLLLQLENYTAQYLEPATCDPEWLDILAYWGGWGNYWDGSWSVAIKRALLINNDYIWRNRGNREIMPFLFKIFGLNASIRPQSGWILGTSTLPATLVNDPFAFAIAVPAAYGVGSPERQLISRLCSYFLPCWISIVYTTV